VGEGEAEGETETETETDAETEGEGETEAERVLDGFRWDWGGSGLLLVGGHAESGARVAPTRGEVWVSLEGCGGGLSRLLRRVGA